MGNLLVTECENHCGELGSMTGLIPKRHEGTLSKRSAMLLVFYQSRHCVLEEGTFTYYADSGREEIRGSICLKSCLVTLIAEKSPYFTITVSFKGEHRKIDWKAKNEEDWTEWVQALQKHIRFYRNMIQVDEFANSNDEEVSPPPKGKKRKNDTRFKSTGNSNAKSPSRSPSKQPPINFSQTNGASSIEKSKETLDPSAITGGASPGGTLNPLISPRIEQAYANYKPPKTKMEKAKDYGKKIADATASSAKKAAEITSRHVQQIAGKQVRDKETGELQKSPYRKGAMFMGQGSVQKAKKDGYLGNAEANAGGEHANHGHLGVVPDFNLGGLFHEDHQNNQNEASNGHSEPKLTQEDIDKRREENVKRIEKAYMEKVKREEEMMRLVMRGEIGL